MFGGETLTYPYGIPRSPSRHNRFRDCQVGGPGYGSARITGSAFDTDLGNTPTGNNAIFTILKNGTDQLYQYTVVNLDSTGQAYDVTTTIAAGITFTSKLPRGVQQLGQHLHEPVIIYSPQPQEEEEIT